jgi:uncharacterized membrane protein YccC
VCDLAIERTRRWASIVEDAMRRTDDLDEVARILMERTVDELDANAERPDSLDDRYDLLTTYRTNAAGLMRYFTRLREARDRLDR